MTRIGRINADFIIRVDPFHLCHPCPSPRQRQSFPFGSIPPPLPLGSIAPPVSPGLVRPFGSIPPPRPLGSMVPPVSQFPFGHRPAPSGLPLGSTPLPS